LTKVDTVFKDVMVNQILFDAQSNTWVGSENGLYKYSSNDFERCGSGSLSREGIEKMRRGATWIASTTNAVGNTQGQNQMYRLGDKRESAVFGIKLVRRANFGSPRPTAWVITGKPKMIFFV